MKKKMNNKGFSLVELIVVIAIMAVLIGVLAPTLLGNIEKSKLAKDKDAIDVLYKAWQNTAGDPKYAIGYDKTYTYDVTNGKITINAAPKDGAGTASIMSADDSSKNLTTEFVNELVSYVGGNDIQLSSKYYKTGSAKVNIIISAQGRVGLSVEDNESSDSKGDYKVNE